MSSADDTIILINIDNVCRICLVESNDMQSVFNKIEEKGILENAVLNLADVLARVTNVVVNPDDGFPSLICSNCVSLVCNAYKFKVQFDHSYSILQQYASEAAKANTYEYIENSQNLPDSDITVGLPHSEVNADDHFVAVLAKSEPEQLGTRQTSTQQIEKRETKQTRHRPMNNRGRKRKIKSTDDENAVNKNDERVILHPCPICTKQFTAFDLREHAHTHKALSKYLKIPQSQMIQSNTRFYKTVDPAEETVGLHSLEEKVHKCALCDVECSANALRLHLQKHRNQTNLKCDQCERVFKKLNHLNTHKVKHLKEHPFKCAQCGKGFVIETNYKCHMLTHNSTEELPHECKYCLKRFSNPEHLNRHILMHTENVSYSVKYKVCKCLRCYKSFKDRQELQAHNCVPVSQISNIRYPCKVCSKVFTTASVLYNHTRNKHKRPGTKVLCSVCGSYVANISTHMSRHTGERPFQCNECGKRFVGRPQLNQHMLVHSGLKPYICTICGKAFNNLYNLQVHERIHVGNRCHVCVICGKGFLEKAYLKKHMNIHSKL